MYINHNYLAKKTSIANYPHPVCKLPRCAGTEGVAKGCHVSHFFISLSFFPIEEVGMSKFTAPPREMATAKSAST